MFPRVHVSISTSLLAVILPFFCFFLSCLLARVCRRCRRRTQATGVQVSISISRQGSDSWPWVELGLGRQTGKGSEEQAEADSEAEAVQWRGKHTDSFVEERWGWWEGGWGVVEGKEGESR